MSKTDICKKCKKKEFDLKQGLICGLTHEKATFEDTCSSFENDESIIEKEVEKLKPNEQRSKTVLALIWIVLILEIFGLASSILQYDLLSTVSSGGEITNDAAYANDLREQIIGILYFVTYVISGITFIMWFRRAYFNLHIKVNHLSYNEGRAAGGWFIPFANLYQPYQIMKELYIETKNLLLNKDESLQVELTTNFLGYWWTLWIVSGVLGQIIFRLSRNADTLPELLLLTILSIISGVIGIGLALITIRIVKDYSKVEVLLEEY